MTKWLKFYATYTFYTSPNLRHRTTLLNTDVPNCHILAIMPSTYQNVLKWGKIWRSSNKNKNAQFFLLRHSVYPNFAWRQMTGNVLQGPSRSPTLGPGFRGNIFLWPTMYTLT